DVKGVAGTAEADDFTVGFRATAARGGCRLDDEEGAAFGHDEAIALAIEGARGGGGRIVARGEGAEVAEAADTHRRDGAFGRAGEDDVGPTAANPLPGHAERHVAAGAGGRNGGD